MKIYVVYQLFVGIFFKVWKFYSNSLNYETLYNKQKMIVHIELFILLYFNNTFKMSFKVPFPQYKYQIGFI